MKLDSSKLLSIFYLIAAFFLRPTAFGSNYTFIGLLMVSSITLTYLIINFKDKIKINVIGSNLIIFGIFLLFIIYELSISLYFGNSNLRFLAGDFIAQLIIFLCYLVFLLNSRNNEIFFSYLAKLIAFFGWSSLITLILFNFSSPENFLIFNYQMNDYPHTGDVVEAGQVYFPLSMTYDYIFQSDLIGLYRFSGFFRESGIFAAICCFVYIYSVLIGLSKSVQWGAALGIILSFSTSGYFVFLTSIIFLYLLRNKTSIIKKISIFILAIFSLFAAFQAPVVGLKYKASTEGYSDSVDRRSDALIKGIQKTIENPFGDGMYSAKEENTGVNLIANIGSIGIIGFLLQIILMSGFRFSFDKIFKLRFIILSPVFITILLAQSIATTPYMYILIFIRPLAIPEKNEVN